MPTDYNVVTAEPEAECPEDAKILIYGGGWKVVLPSALPTNEHTHAIADTTGLQAALDAKAAASHTHTASQVSDFAEAVDDRVAALLVAGSGITCSYDDGAGTLTLSSTGGGAHTHVIADVEDLQAQLDEKSINGHVHTLSEITDFALPNGTSTDMAAGMVYVSASAVTVDSTITTNGSGTLTAVAFVGDGAGLGNVVPGSLPNSIPTDMPTGVLYSSGGSVTTSTNVFVDSDVVHATGFVGSSGTFGTISTDSGAIISNGLGALTTVEIITPLVTTKFVQVRDPGENPTIELDGATGLVGGRGMTFGAIADAEAPNQCLYLSSDQGALCYKDAGGQVYTIAMTAVP